MEKLFNPRSIAIFGASNREQHPGYMMLYALKQCGFKGAVYPINPGKGDILGFKTYESLDGISDDRIDLAIVVVAPSAVLSVMEQIARRRIPFTVLVTAGFRELGTTEGAGLESRITETARKAGIRFVGPNCMGVYSSESGLSFFPDLEPSDGNLALVSQSGSQTFLLHQLARARGISFNKMVSSGNEADLECFDFLNYFATDPKVGVITAYIEGVRSGQRFAEVGRCVSLRKPVIVLKVGATAAGGRAASSHTGAMSGTDAIWDAVLRQSGMIRAESMLELLDFALGFSLIAEPIGRRVAIMGAPGGSSVLSADACERYGLNVATLEAETTNRLREILPPVGTSIRNPIDMGFGAVADNIFEAVLRVVNADRNADVVLALGGAPAFAGASYIRIEEFAKELIAAKSFLTKPLFAVVPQLPQTQGPIMRLAGAGIPVFSEPDHAAKAIARMAWYYEWRNKDK